jgi:hypothetical protein
MDRAPTKDIFALEILILIEIVFHLNKVKHQVLLKTDREELQ